MIKNNLITLHIKRKQLPIFYLFFFIFLLSSGNSRLYAEETLSAGRFFRIVSRYSHKKHLSD